MSERCRLQARLKTFEPGRERTRIVLESATSPSLTAKLTELLYAEGDLKVTLEDPTTYVPGTRPWEVTGRQDHQEKLDLPVAGVEGQLVTIGGVTLSHLRWVRLAEASGHYEEVLSFPAWVRALTADLGPWHVTETAAASRRMDARGGPAAVLTYLDCLLVLQECEVTFLPGSAVEAAVAAPAR